MIKNKLHRILKKYFTFKLYYNRAHSYVSIIMEWSKNIMLVSIFLKMFNITNYWLVFVFFVIALVVVFTIGYFDVKHEVAHLEMSVMNQVNPELMEIHKKVIGDKNGKR